MGFYPHLYCRKKIKKLTAKGHMQNISSRCFVLLIRSKIVKNFFINLISFTCFVKKKLYFRCLKSVTRRSEHMKILKYIVLLVLLLSPVATIQSCRTSNLDNRERQIQREKRKRQRNDTVLYQKALKRHMKSQTKETRKSMRQALNTARRNREGRREFFVKRWFREWFGYKQERNKG